MELPEKIDMLERVADLHLKSYKPTEIARALGITPAMAKKYIADYGQVLQNKLESDPDFLDRIGENTIEALQRMDNIVKEAWETYETAKNNDMITQQINLLKVASDLEDKRAKLLQLMGAKVDGGMYARMYRAEKVNEIVTRTIKEVVADCARCKVEIMPRLAEAFELMNRPEEAADMKPVDVIDAEIIEGEEEWDESDHKAMMLDVFDGS